MKNSNENPTTDNQGVKTDSVQGNDTPSVDTIDNDTKTIDSIPYARFNEVTKQKRDLETKLKDILQWSTNLNTLENAISNDTDGETYTLTTSILRGLNLSGFAQGLIPISNSTGEGIVNLESALSRILNLGEEVED